jgi:hypothetical protein
MVGWESENIMLSQNFSYWNYVAIAILTNMG